VACFEHLDSAPSQFTTEDDKAVRANGVDDAGERYSVPTRDDEPGSAADTPLDQGIDAEDNSRSSADSLNVNLSEERRKRGHRRSRREHGITARRGQRGHIRCL
jgi:hypothetical protein